MTITRGQPWGHPGSLPDHGVVVASDGEAQAVVTEARRSGRPVPPLGLIGGDLCRTLGGRGDRGRLQSGEAMTFPLDLGVVLIDGRLHWFVSHLLAHSASWTRVFVAMNGQWRGRWNLGPRAHPNDGLLDCYDARFEPGDLPKVHGRLRLGSHLPHPRIAERRAGAVQVSFPRPLPVWLDGQRTGRARNLSVRVEPDALTVVI